MRATSEEKRQQIIEAKLRGEKVNIIILWTKVSKSTIDKVWKRYNETGSGRAIPYTGRKSKITPEIEHKIRAKIAERSDITLEELIEDLDLPIKKSQLSKLTIAWGLPFKKRHFMQTDNSEKTCRKSAKNSKTTNPI